MKKKIISVLLMLTLTISMFAGCGKEQTEVTETPVQEQTAESEASGDNSVSALSSCPYTLNSIFDDGGDYVYYYYVDTVDSMHGTAKEAMYDKGFDDNNIIWEYEDMGTFAEGHVLKCIMKNGTW